MTWNTINECVCAYAHSYSSIIVITSYLAIDSAANKTAYIKWTGYGRCFLERQFTHETCIYVFYIGECSSSVGARIRTSISVCNSLYSERGIDRKYSMENRVAQDNLLFILHCSCVCVCIRICVACILACSMPIVCSDSIFV